MKHGALLTGLTRFNGALLACFQSVFLMLGVSLLASTEEDSSLPEFFLFFSVSASETATGGEGFWRFYVFMSFSKFLILFLFNYACFQKLLDLFLKFINYQQVINLV